MTTPALLGGSPAFPDGLQFARPLTPSLDKVAARLRPTFEKGILTDGPLVKQFEAEAAVALGAKHAVAVSSCTSGLILGWRALVPAGTKVALPSFTFSASGHALVWCGLEPVMVECDPITYMIDLEHLERVLDTSGAEAVLATHIFGAPAQIDELLEIGERRGVKVAFDAAHAFGATTKGRPVAQFGEFSVFSMSSTKLVVSGEGGIVTTNDDDLAQAVRLGRNYGNPGDYNTQFIGLNARMSELHAAVALESLALLDEHLLIRRDLADRYNARIADIPGVRVQLVVEGDESTWKDYTIDVDPDVFGLTRDELKVALLADGIDTRLYFYPPLHQQDSYAARGPFDLPVTEQAAAQVISLPMFGELTAADVDGVCDVLASLQARAAEVRLALAAAAA